LLRLQPKAVALPVVALALLGIRQHVIRVAQLAPEPVLPTALERVAPVCGFDLLRRRLARDAERCVVVGHETVLRLLCSRRHSSIFPWSPERRTSGTRQPRNSGGRV